MSAIDHDISIISHIVVLYDFHHNQLLIRLVMTVQYCFRRKPLLYDRSHCCPIWFSSQITLGLIDHDSSISFLAYTASLCPETSLFLSQTTPDLIGENNLVSLLAYTAPVQSIMSLSLLVFVRDRTRFSRSRQLNFGFGVD